LLGQIAAYQLFLHSSLQVICHFLSKLHERLAMSHSNVFGP